jgi:hypothetical protein
MKSVKINTGEVVYETDEDEWKVFSVNVKNMKIYGYKKNNIFINDKFITDGVYILHNEEGPSATIYITTEKIEYYALHGKIYNEKIWKHKIREYKLKRILK